MAYRIKGKNGLPIKKDGQFLMGSDLPIIKIEQMDEVNKSFVAVASTEDEDRDKDIIRANGWQLDNFLKNPVIPWGHNYYNPPIGKAISIKKERNKKRLIFQPQFDANDEFAMGIFDKYKNGFLKTFSVGFLGLEWNWRDEENRWYGGREYTKQELLEISCVTVPANPNANMDVRSLNPELPETLAQMGYKQFMCKMDSGLFIPVGDTEIYTNSQVLPMVKGINGVYGNPIDNPEAEKELVGYLFAADMDEKEASKWVADNGFSVSKVKFFDMGEKQIGDKEFELEVVEEEIDVEEKGIGIELNDNDEIEEVEEEMEEIPEEEEKDIENTETKEETEEKDPTEAIEEKMEEEEDKECMVEMSISVKDMEGKELKSKKKKKKMMMSEADMDAMMKRAFFKDKEKEFSLSEDNIKTIVNELKKSVVKEEEIDNNEDVNSVIELSEETEESKNGEIVEFDASLFSPVSEDNDSEDSIEIDEKVFDEVKLQMKTDSKQTLQDVLEKSIKQVMKDFSGKLED